MPVWPRQPQASGLGCHGGHRAAQPRLRLAQAAGLAAVAGAGARGYVLVRPPGVAAAHQHGPRRGRGLCWRRWPTSRWPQLPAGAALARPGRHLGQLGTRGEGPGAALRAVRARGQHPSGRGSHAVAPRPPLRGAVGDGMASAVWVRLAVGGRGTACPQPPPEPAPTAGHCRQPVVAARCGRAGRSPSRTTVGAQAMPCRRSGMACHRSSRHGVPAAGGAAAERVRSHRAGRGRPSGYAPARCRHRPRPRPVRRSRGVHATAGAPPVVWLPTWRPPGAAGRPR